MLKRLIGLAAFAAFIALPLSLSAQATGSVCADGTHSNATGSGACSGHGGVDQAATTAAHNAAKKPKPAPAPAAPAPAPSAAHTTTAPVKCADGTTSNTSGSGACSHHGGVAHTNANAAPNANPAPAPAAHPAPAPAPAPAAPNANAGPVRCVDGTTSNVTGSGACSHHGGVAHANAAAPAPAPAAHPAPAPAAAPANTTNPNASGGAVNNDPQGATAKCKDGAYSHSKTHSGTCSTHGGVAQWLDGTKPN